MIQTQSTTAKSIWVSMLIVLKFVNSQILVNKNNAQNAIYSSNY